MSQRIQRDRSRGHRLTAREWNEHCRELNRLRTIQGVENSGTLVHSNAGGVMIQAIASLGASGVYYMIATTYGWEEWDMATGAIKSGGITVETDDVVIVDALGLDYPAYTTAPTGVNTEKRTQAIFVKIGDKYAAVIPDFTQTYYVVCTDVDYREFTECTPSGETFDGARVLTGVTILGDPEETRGLSAYPDEPTYGLHTLIIDEYDSAWEDAIILANEPGYAYYYE